MCAEPRKEGKKEEGKMGGGLLLQPGGPTDNKKRTFIKKERSGRKKVLPLPSLCTSILFTNRDSAPLYSFAYSYYCIRRRNRSRLYP